MKLVIKKRPKKCSLQIFEFPYQSKLEKCTSKKWENIY